jgi:HEAT repeat protein
VAIGPPVLPELLATLGDPAVPHAIRRHVPMTVAAMGTPRAADLLLQHVLVETDGMIRFKSLRALGRLRAEHPGLPLDEGRLTEAFGQTLQAAFELMRRRRALEVGAHLRRERLTPIHNALVALLRDKQLHAVERLFRLLDLITNDEDLPRIHRGFRSMSSDTRARSRELIEHLVFPRFRAPLLTLLDDLYELSAQGRYPEGAHDAYEAVLAQLAGDRMESLSAFALAQIKSLRLRGLIHYVQDRPEFSAFHADIVRRAREALAGTDV